MSQAIVICSECQGENAIEDAVCRHCAAALLVKPKSETGLPVGTLLINKRFEIKKKLGEGGMGEVYLCFDERLSRKVALKCISGARDDNEVRARFLREARVASQLDHPNICPIYEIYEEELSQYIVMQYVDGVTLETVRRHQKLNYNQIIDIALQVCQGMQAAHENGVVHRDIKAANIMIDRQGRIKILDFGLAKVSRSQLLAGGGETVPMTEKGMVIGTVTHMSPEQAKGEELDERTDIFSFGVVLFELLEGHNPFWNRDTITTLYNIINTAPEFSETLPGTLRTVVSSCLEKNRKKRVASFSELAEQLSTCQRVLSGEAERNPAHTEILSGDEVEVIKKAINSSTGNQDLKDIVYRINRFKVTTSPISAIKRKGLKLALTIGLVLALLVIALMKLIPGGAAPSSGTKTEPLALVMIEPFTAVKSAMNHGESLAELVAFALNQHHGIAAVMPGWFSEESAVLADLKNKQSIKSHGLNVLYILSGQLSVSDGAVFIKARLEERGASVQPMEVTLTGIGYSSLLSHQVKALCERVARRVLGDTPQAIVANLSLTDLFGNDWEKSVSFFEAQKLYRRLDYVPSERILKNLAFMPPARYLLAEIAFFNGKRSDAEDIVKKVLPKLDQLPPQLNLLYRSFNHRLRTEPDLELELLKELASQNPLDKYTQYRLGEAHFHTGNATEAIPYYLAALELDGAFDPALNHIAYCYAYQGHHDKALDYFEKYHQLDQSPNSFDSFGDGYYYAGNLDTAEAFKKNALAREPGEMDWALLTLADIHVLKSDYSAADAAVDRYAALAKEDKKDLKLSESLTKKAWARMMMGRYEVALNFLDRAISLYDARSLDEHCRETHWLRGWALVLLGRHDQAREEQKWLDELVERHQLSEKRFSALLKYSHHLRALSEYAVGNKGAALAELRRILEYGERLNYWTTFYNQSFFHCELIRHLISANHLDEAAVEIEAAARFNPRYPPLLWLKLQLARKTKQNDAHLLRQLREILGTDAPVPPPLLMK